jgi:UDP:flavonoid glycosyltransferase YjiC (YdhE family)
MRQKGHLDADLLQFIKSGSRPVYVGFGSMTARDPQETTEIVLAATKLAGQRLVLSSGWAQLGSKAGLDSDCYVLGKCDHAQLFPTMAAIVHHGGSGTTATAARSGVPQIIIPHMTDQFYFAEQVPQLGIAPKSIWRKNLTPKRLAAAMLTAVSDVAMQQRCRALTERLNGQNSYAMAERFIRNELLS